MSNFREMAPNGSGTDVRKISNFKIMNILYIILKHVVWRFRIYNYFCEIFKFRENMSKNRFREISLSVHKIYNTLIFLKFEIFSKSCSGAIAEPFRENCS